MVGAVPVTAAEASSVGCNAAKSVGLAQWHDQWVKHGGAHGPSMQEDECRFGFGFGVSRTFGRAEGCRIAGRRVISVEKLSSIERACEARHACEIVFPERTMAQRFYQLEG